jgi:phosphoribosylamine--glycine ligase
MVLEYNCRLGDPEAQVVLPCIDADLLELVAAAAEEDLGSVAVPRTMGAAVGVVLASAGYPDLSRTGMRIEGIEVARARGARVYVAGARATENGLVTTGGRICTVVGKAGDLATARRVAYDALSAVQVEGAFHRRDIAAIASEEPCPNPASAS